MDLIIKVFSIGICISIAGRVLKNQGREDQAIMLELVGLVICIALVYTKMSSVITGVFHMFDI